ncbi:dodecenoyl-CoA isomerase [Yamadazyma tenuis]|uniref:ClpP/crotonase n=1 Tax=Candida tenuis (strain ATCC 10573 / BCRC 21748 / CBS 615 / JCM 9827 / NBRC 10315 / NRRL Y-1498 / VKM Y-70) TaxID=590646 RepID=G3AYA1_CANTC|nr:ClpP/crotonase [Yamadazyma tenuis ATCC 10573]EGV65799.1 ClpP/crotonase [Yamadazyma tenuis ATCC 10573]WEJ95871.1 dodecenoyl-CoA isomerase [Yamadazyma tenuis]
MAEDIIYEVRDRTVVITLNIPDKLNSLNGEQYMKLARAVEDADNEEGTVVTIIQSTGRFFSAGANFSDKGISQAKTEDLFSHDYWLNKFVARNTYITNVFHNHKKVLVAAVNGPVIGLSAALVALCDLIYVKDDTQFYILCPFSNLGLVCEGATSATLFMRLGWSKASEALLFARPIQGPELTRLGFVNKAYNDYKFASTEEFNAQIYKDVVAQFENLHEASIFLNKELLKVNREPAIHAANSKEVVMGLYKWVEGVPQSRFVQLAQKDIKHKM